MLAVRSEGVSVVPGAELTEISFSQRSPELLSSHSPPGTEPVEIQLQGADAFECLRGSAAHSRGALLWAPCLAALVLPCTGPAV